MAKNRRSKVLINPKFQIKFLIYLNLILLILLIFYASIILHVVNVLADAQIITQVQYHQFQSGVLPWIIIVHFIIHFTMTIVMLFVSHRIAGPIERFKYVIRSFLQDDYFPSEIKTRKNDYFDEFRDLINMLNQKLRSNYIDHQEIINQLQEVMSENISTQLKQKIEKLLVKNNQNNRPIP